LRLWVDLNETFIKLSFSLSFDVNKALIFKCHLT
jgi:hypothetical protein